MRKNLSPGKESRMNKINFSRFNNGTVNDPPASEINNALADSTNLTIFDGYYEGRTGCVPYGQPIERLSGRTGYTAHKDGQNIVSDSGDIFSSSDVGQRFDFGTVSELITEYVDAQTVVGSNTDYLEGSNCGVIGTPDMVASHKQKKKWIIATAGDVRVADIDMQEWTSAMCISNEFPGPSRMDYSEYRDWMLLFTITGMFRVELGATPICYQINIDPPTVKITDSSEVSAAHSYRYLYSATRIHGDSENRKDLVEIDIETGTNTPDSTDVDFSLIEVVNEISSSYPQKIEVLTMPVDSGGSPQRHLTHYTLWRTEDLEAKDPDDVYKEKYNDPNRFVWVDDVKACVPLFGTISGSTFTITVGELKDCDKYSFIEIEGGELYEITSVTDSTHCEINLDLRTPTTDPVAGAIGGGRLLRGSITSGVLTLTYGTLTSADLHTTVYTSTGKKTILTEILGADSARVSTTEAFSEQAFSCNPVARRYCDIIDDTTLHARKDFYTCRNRFKKALPNCNVGAVITGFVACGIRGASEVYYTNIESSYSQFLGQYVPGIQKKSEIKDSIQAMWVFDGVLSVFCATSTWGSSIGISEFEELPSSTELVAKLPGFKLTDKHRGCLDIDSISEAENGMIMIVTNEPGGESMRLFDGILYSEADYIANRYSKRFNRTIKKSVAVYDGLFGYVIWRKAE